MLSSIKKFVLELFEHWDTLALLYYGPFLTLIVLILQPYQLALQIFITCLYLSGLPTVYYPFYGKRVVITDIIFLEGNSLKMKLTLSANISKTIALKTKVGYRISSFQLKVNPIDLLDIQFQDTYLTPRRGRPSNKELVFTCKNKGLREFFLCFQVKPKHRDSCSGEFAIEAKIGRNWLKVALIPYVID